jgi:hypothetical protein
MVLSYKSKEPGNIAQLKCEKPYDDLKACVPLLWNARHMSGTLCGLQPGSKSGWKWSHFGTKKAQGWGLRALAWLTAYKSGKTDRDWSNLLFPKWGNDGMVGFTSCRSVGADTANDMRAMQFGSTPDSSFYAAKLNHADGTCRNGDVKNDPAMQPCQWITFMVQNAIERRLQFVEGRNSQGSGHSESLNRAVVQAGEKLKASRAARLAKEETDRLAVESAISPTPQAMNDLIHKTADQQKVDSATPVDWAKVSPPPQEAFIEMGMGDMVAGNPRFLSLFGKESDETEAEEEDADEEFEEEENTETEEEEDNEDAEQTADE